MTCGKWGISSNSEPAGELSIGTFTNASGTYGLPANGGVVISSGDVADYEDGPNLSSSNTTDYGVPATVAQEGLLDPITGGFLNHNDVTQIDITFDMLPGFDTVFFDVVFGSDEYDEFVGSSFIDAFGLYVNGTNIASVGGLPINIDHPDMAFLPGTELDGILAPGGVPLLEFSQFVGDGSVGNILTFIIADSGDSALDSTAYITALGGSDPDVPEPSALVALVSLGLIGSLSRKSKKN